MFPIKYIDNNLVWNKDNEVFAYYELIPYNYSFLSAEQKFIVHDSFRQLIAQSREGKIHALQIATESSVRSIQEQSKKLVTGRLRDVAIQKIDEQTEALVSMIGDNQVDYRFFIGFKLIVTEEKVSLESVKKSAFMTFKEFLNEVNHTLMNDFISMPDDEINRYMKMEKLLENKISRRFKFRRLDKNDFGYLIEHIYGGNGVAYEDYEYSLPKKKLKKATLIKQYDLIRPTRCLVEESQRYLRLEHEDSESFVSYFTVNAIVGELDFPSSEIFYFQQQQFTFPVDTSMNVEIVGNRKALSTVRNKKKELKDLDNHAYQSGSETSSNVVDALDSVDELETDLDQSKESMYKLSYVIRVSAPDLDELKRRCDEVKDFYDDLNVKLVRPAGDMLGLHSEFLPASKRYINDYVQYVKSDFLAGLGFGATQQLGENTGIYIGYSVDTGRNVYLQPSLASQGVKGTVTNALASAFVGSLGGGKSFCNNLIVYYSVLFGGQAVILDPKSERGNWKETLPEIAHEINIVNLTSDKENAGLLDPFVIMKNVKDAESLAIDILTFLTGISSRDGEKFPVLRKAVRAVTQSNQRGLLHVIDELRREDTAIARNIADHIDSFTDYDFAHLLFSDGSVSNAISLDNQLNIIQVADLALPDKDTTFEEYTTIGVYKNFTAIDQHTTHEVETIQLRLNDTNGIENFVKNFCKSYYTWSNSKEAIEARTQAISAYLTQGLQDLNVDTVRTDIPTSSTVTDVLIWDVEQSGENAFTVTYEVDQQIKEGDQTRDVSETYTVTVHVDADGDMVIIQNPTLAPAMEKSSYEPKAQEADNSVDADTAGDATAFLETFFKLYPTATDKELAYYVEGNALEPINGDYLYSEIVNPVFTADGDNVKVKVAVKFIDNQTKATQVSQYELTLHKDSNWKIIG